MATGKQVAEFLNRFKISMGFEFFAIVQREKNLQGIADLGMTISEAKKILANLTIENYSSGPEADQDGLDESVWVFGAGMKDKEIYIKLKLALNPQNDNFHVAKVLAFHPARHALRYPLKGE